jgi:uncharacterized protein YjbJ (UPF0337 family)
VRATRLVLDGDDAGGRQGFELRFAHTLRGTGRSLTTTQEVRTMGIEEQAKGKLDEAKGRAKQAQGDLTDDEAKKQEGKYDESKGKVRQASDKAKGAIHDLTR